MLTQNDIDLLNKSSKGESVLLIAPVGREFEDNFQRILVDDSKITIMTKKGDELESMLRMEDVATNIEDGLWGIREVFEAGKKK